MSNIMYSNISKVNPNKSKIKVASKQSQVDYDYQPDIFVPKIFWSSRLSDYATVIVFDYIISNFSLATMTHASYICDIVDLHQCNLL